MDKQQLTFWCFGCEAYVDVAPYTRLSDLESILTPLGWEHVEIDGTGDRSAWVCSDCLYCPDCRNGTHVPKDEKMN